MESRWDETWERVPGSDLRGGQGNSFLATWKNGTPGQVFIKNLRRPRDMEGRKRFRREVAAYETLSHSGLPNLISDNSADWEDLATSLFLVLECIEGGTLPIWMQEQGPMPIDLAVNCVVSLCDTVEHCHSEGVLHRDLKPSNVMLRDLNPATPVIVDFGLAFNEDWDELGDVTRSGEEIGNRFLRLPEAWNNRNAISDVTHVAGLFFYMLAGVEPHVLVDQYGNAPHRREEEGEILRAISLDQRRFFRLMALFDRAFKTASAERFQSIGELSTAVEGIFALVPNTSTLEGLMTQLDEVLGQTDDVTAAANTTRLKAFVDHATSLSTSLAESKGLKSLCQGYVYRSGDVDLALMNQTDTSQPPYSQFRFEMRGTSDVTLKVDGAEVWTARDTADPGLTEAIQRRLIEAYLQTHQGPHGAMGD